MNTQYAILCQLILGYYFIPELRHRPADSASYSEDTEELRAKQHAAAVATDDEEFVDLFLPWGLDSHHKRMREKGARFASAVGENEMWPRSCDATFSR